MPKRILLWQSKFNTILKVISLFLYTFPIFVLKRFCDHTENDKFLKEHFCHFWWCQNSRDFFPYDELVSNILGLKINIIYPSVKMSDAV